MSDLKVSEEGGDAPKSNLTVGTESTQSNDTVDTASKATCEVNIAVENEIEEGKNKYLVKCKFCPSQILSPGSGEYTKLEFDLPEIGRKKQQPSPSRVDQNQSVIYEQLTHFWSVPDMYVFENIGFSNTVGEIKYLACADCEIGPIGYFDTKSKVSFVALGRVSHDH